MEKGRREGEGHQPKPGPVQSTQSSPARSLARRLFLFHCPSQQKVLLLLRLTPLFFFFSSPSLYLSIISHLPIVSTATTWVQEKRSRNLFVRSQSLFPFASFDGNTKRRLALLFLSMDLYAPPFFQLVSFFHPLLSLSPFFGTGCCYPAQPFFTLPSCLWPCPVRRGKV